jgi:hypothetical protein
MKSLYLFTFLLAATSLQAQDEGTGLPGDHFSLAGALELFKKAGTPEEFERLLNTEDSKVNNLDLNGDGNTDYIRVINKKDGDVQVFILQALVSESENQDIAVIELEKTGSESAVVQITGDEEIYGKELIVEPGDEEGRVYHPSNLRGPAAFDTEYFDSGNGIVVNVWAWPVVRFVYAPGYVVWVSPFSWTYRPVWYRPWRPLHWHVYRPLQYGWHRHYTVVHTHRIMHARAIYRPVRVTSVTVRTRHQVAVNNYRVKRSTHTRNVTTAHGKKYQVTRRHTTVHGRHGGHVSRGTTTVRRKR